MKFCVYIIVGALACSIFTCVGTNVTPKKTATADWLLPTPKEVNIDGSINIKTGNYFIYDKFGTPPETLNWLEDGLKKSLGWKLNTNDKNTYSIRIEKLEKSNKKEFYELAVDKNGIVLRAATKAGLYRAFGRLLCLADSPLVKVLADGSTQIPQLSIRDWPDYPLRGMYLRFDYRVDVDFQKKYLEVMARLGFNCAFFEIGGYFESETHPEFCCEQRWTKKQLKELIAYAKARGITPWPGLNSIGHLHSGPRIFPITGKRGQNGTVGQIVSNIANPDYYRVYFAMTDELADIFDKPEYIHIGTDEFHNNRGVEILEKKTGKPGHEFFADFLNKVSAHFAARNMKTVVWHDMLATRKCEKKMQEPAHGIRTAKAIETIDKRIVIDYWCYRKLGKYPIFDGLLGRGFPDIWVTTWEDSNAAEELFDKAFSKGVKGAFGSTWNLTPHREAFPETAEYSWNATASKHRKSSYVYNTFKDIYFYGRNTGKAPVAGAVQVSNINGIAVPSSGFIQKIKTLYPKMTLESEGLSIAIANPRSFFIFGATPPPEIPHFKNAKELSSYGKVNNILLYVDGLSYWISATGTDKRRNTNDCIIYTPAYGKTTRTNQYGAEIAVIDGLITKKSSSGNMKIPPNGFVISGHGRKNCNFLMNLQAGSKLSLLLNKATLVPETISIPLNGKRCAVAIAVEYPVHQEVTLAKVEVVFSDGSRHSLGVRGNMFFHPVRLWGGWKIWSVINGKTPQKGMNKILVIEWQKLKNKKIHPKKLEITVSRYGIESGFAVLGGVLY